MAKKPQEAITITVSQAHKSINMCKSNAWALMNDAIFLCANDRLQYVPILMQFAFEEIGKAKIIYDKIKSASQANTITLTKSDHLYDHEFKLKVFLQLLEEAHENEIKAGVVFSNYHEENKQASKESKPFLRNSKSAIRELIEQGHRLRLDSSFVDFDIQTGEPKIGHNLDKITLKSIAEAYQSVKELFVYPPI